MRTSFLDIDEILEQYDEAWQSASPPALEQFLITGFTGAKALDPAAQQKLLIELVKIDLDNHWRRGRPNKPFLPDYVGRFPKLLALDKLPADLIGTEYWVRHCWGDHPRHEDYLKRFPAQADQLRELLPKLDAELASTVGHGSRFSRLTQNREPPPATSVQPINAVGSLIAAIGQLHLVTAAKLAEVNALASRFNKSQDLARHLLDRKLLTPYQANLLFTGRGHELALGPYVFLERLADGGKGQVFKARHRKMNRLVVLKVLRREFLTGNDDGLQRFFREIRLASDLSHINVVHAFDAGPIGRTHVLAMEFVDGTDLARTIKEAGLLPVAQACDYIRQTALGLQYIHEHGMVHRDIKPSNLMVARAPDDGGRTGHLPWGLIKILDLGLALLVQPGNGKMLTTLTKEGAVLGTPDYMAPEQATDAHHVDSRADLYSLGCTWYQLLTKQPPFPGGTFIQKIDRHRWDKPRPIRELRPEVPERVAAMVHKLLEKDPKDRYQQSGELAKALGGLFRSRVQRPGSPASPPRFFSRRMIVIAAAGAAAVLLVLTLVFLSQRQPDQTSADKTEAKTTPTAQPAPMKPVVTTHKDASPKAPNDPGPDTMSPPPPPPPPLPATVFSSVPFLGDAANWDAYPADVWKVVHDEGDLRYFKKPNQAPLEYSLIKGRNYGDFTLTFKVKAAAPGALDAQGYFVVFGHNDWNNWCALHMGARLDNTILKCIRDGKARELSGATRPGIPDSHRYHQVIVARKKGTVGVYLDGLPILSITDRQLDQSGQLGFGAGAAFFDDITIDGQTAEVKPPDITTDPMPDAPLTWTLPAEADAYVRGGSDAGKNYGKEAILAVKTDASDAGNSREVFIRFDLSSVTGPISGAKVKLFPSAVNPRPNHTAVVTEDNSWTEQGISWKNKPKAGATLATWYPTLNKAVEFDVSAATRDALAGNKKLAIKVFSDSNDKVDYGSREAVDPNHRPQLFVARKVIPASPVIADIQWDFQTLVRQARGSGHWPTTWAKDGHLYTAWSDGSGFGAIETDVATRVKLGFARIEGSPPSFKGVNLLGGKSPLYSGPPPSVVHGTRALISVDGVLWTWLSDNTLLSSQDMGATWKQSWRFEAAPEGGWYPRSFLQFGQDYAGARDDYVYIYGSMPLCLARVPKKKLAERVSYEFFAGMAGREPIWVKESGKAKPVLHESEALEDYPGIVWNPGIKRYLLLAARDWRPSRLAVYDAPEPWGPWTQAAAFENFATLGYSIRSSGFSLPSKWISPDGKTIWCVFSGSWDKDRPEFKSFQLIKGTIVVREQQP